ncbi:hypothetical protein, partial [Paraburkholderia sediminicola]|uniref:hypothetical protein n=1 Tax=Paraburkholderia sediminicola TaxID=458836 RepID=UPI0038B709D8
KKSRKGQRRRQPDEQAPRRQPNQGKANAAGNQTNKRRAGNRIKERPTPQAYRRTSATNAKTSPPHGAR